MTATTQHMKALAWANEVRQANATFRHDVMSMSPRDGAEYVAEAIEQDFDHDTFGAFPMDRLLMSVSRLGQHKMSRCLTAAGVGFQHKRLRDLTPRQREAVAAQLRLWGMGYRG